MRIPERALRTPPSYTMGGAVLGDPHATPPWLLPPPPPQRGVERRSSPYRRAFWSCCTRAPRPHVPVRVSRAHSHEPHHETHKPVKASQHGCAPSQTCLHKNEYRC
eukprot:1691544-Prymnesium_polylepis.1